MMKKYAFILCDFCAGAGQTKTSTWMGNTKKREDIQRNTPISTCNERKNKMSS